MLRPALLGKIDSMLDSIPLLFASDFRVSSDASGEVDGVHLRVEYTYGDGEFFDANIPLAAEHRSPDRYHSDLIPIKCKPGRLTAEEGESAASFRGMMECMQAWATRITEDFQLSPIFREVSAQRSVLDELGEQLNDVPDTFATAEEAARLRDWLSQLETELKERIDQLEIATEEKEKRISQLEEEFTSLRRRANTSKVKTMLRAIVSRVYRFASDPDLPQLVENGKSIVRLLGGPPSEGN